MAAQHCLQEHTWRARVAAEADMVVYLRGVTWVHGMAFGVPVVPDEKRTFETVSGDTASA